MILTKKEFWDPDASQRRHEQEKQREQHEKERLEHIRCHAGSTLFVTLQCHPTHLYFQTVEDKYTLTTVQLK